MTRTDAPEMKIAPSGDNEIVVTREFDATPAMVFAAYTTPALLKRWLLGPDGWTMPVCINEGKPGGKIRYEWSNGKGGAFFLTGEILELDPPHRIVHVERMHMPDPTPDNRVVTTFVADGSGTLMTMRMSLPDAETRQAMLATGMARGMEASYVRLERLSGWKLAS